MDLQVIERQKAYYETRFDAYSSGEGSIAEASSFTNLWWGLRTRMGAADHWIGNRSAILNLHRQWLGDLRDRAVLDLGCFSGNDLSLMLAREAASYRGIDLSEKAIGELNRKLALLGRPNASALAVDVLNNRFPDASFDVIYAKSVLHHFPDLDEICRELSRLLKDGCVIISEDPLQTEPLNRLARLIYRPFQTDRAWEWPFTRSSIQTLERHFEIVDMMGLWGASKIALPFAAMPFGQRLATRIGRWGLRIDQTHARRPGALFFACWTATMLLRKQGPHPTPGAGPSPSMTRRTG